MTIVQYSVGFVGTLLLWGLMNMLGRHTIFVGGMLVLNFCLLIIGFTGIAPQHKPTYWATGAMLVVFTFFYDCAVGPVVYSLVSELGSVRLRFKTVVLARVLFNIGSIINSLITPYMLRPDGWNWGAKTGFFWFGLNTIFLVWSFFRVPEPDILFEKKMSARHFKGTEVSLVEQDIVRS